MEYKFTIHNSIFKFNLSIFANNGKLTIIQFVGATCIDSTASFCTSYPSYQCVWFNTFITYGANNVNNSFAVRCSVSVVNNNLYFLTNLVTPGFNVANISLNVFLVIGISSQHIEVVVFKCRANSTNVWGFFLSGRFTVSYHKIRSTTNTIKCGFNTSNKWASSLCIKHNSSASSYNIFCVSSPVFSCTVERKSKSVFQSSTTSRKIAKLRNRGSTTSNHNTSSWVSAIQGNSYFGFSSRNSANKTVIYIYSRRIFEHFTQRTHGCFWCIRQNFFWTTIKISGFNTNYSTSSFGFIRTKWECNSSVTTFTKRYVAAVGTNHIDIRTWENFILRYPNATAKCHIIILSYSISSSSSSSNFGIGEPR